MLQGTGSNCCGSSLSSRKCPRNEPNMHDSNSSLLGYAMIGAAEVDTNHFELK